MRPCARSDVTCPTINELAGYLNDTLAINQRVQVAQAAGGCERCTELLKLGANLKAWSPDLAEDLALAEFGIPDVRPTMRLHPLPIGIACVLSISLALLLFGYVSKPTDVGGFFSRQRVSTLHPLDLVYPSPNGRLLNAPDRLLWDESALAKRDQAVVLMSENQPDLTLNVTRPGLLKLGPQVVAKLEPGEYQWRVLDANQQAIAGPYRFTISP